MTPPRRCWRTEKSSAPRRRNGSPARKMIPIFPRNAVQFCLRHARLDPAQLDAVVFYDKPVLKFARLLETYLAVAPGGWRTFPTVLSNWLGGKLDLRKTIRARIARVAGGLSKFCSPNTTSPTPPAHFIRRRLMRRRSSRLTAWANGRPRRSARGQGNQINCSRNCAFRIRLACSIPRSLITAVSASTPANTNSWAWRRTANRNLPTPSAAN